MEAKSFPNELWRHHDALKEMTTTWPQALVAMLAKGVEKHDAAKVFKDLTIITFNYDRCCEALLFHALQPTFGITASEAAQIMTLPAVSA